MVAQVLTPFRSGSALDRARPSGRKQRPRDRSRANRSDTMILEIALLDIKPGSEAQFEAGAREAAPLFRNAKGCRSMKVQRSIEKPQLYILFVEWETLEDHTETFRSSEAFQNWRALVGPTFASPPDVQHTSMAVDNF
jgi:heme-degrading monooxygenase HmoA